MPKNLLSRFATKPSNMAQVCSRYPGREDCVYCVGGIAGGMDSKVVVYIIVSKEAAVDLLERQPRAALLLGSFDRT